MASASPRIIPGTPRVISPSPDPPEGMESATGDYFLEGDTASANGRSTSPRINLPSRKGSKETVDRSADPEFRARSRSRDSDGSIRRRRFSGLTPLTEDGNGDIVAASGQSANLIHKKTGFLTVPNSGANGHLSPGNAVKHYWRELSRSPSPLGLIPIHREWRVFIHRHEIPRKALHVSIGCLTVLLYARGDQPSDWAPVQFGLLVPITLLDVLRHNWPPFNRLYIRAVGAFMRESEAHDKYNGVIWYLLGTFVVLQFYPKDVAIVCICLLSWCDTAASTFGRRYGRYTPRIRRGKSLAGSLAAFVFGIATAAMFWGWLGPRYERLGIADNSGPYAFAFQGTLGLPHEVAQLLGLAEDGKTVSVSGWIALGLMSLWSGLVASVSEAVDVFGLDDNVTIPILCGVGLITFLKVFGSA